MIACPSNLLRVPDQEHPSDLETWLEDGVAAVTRVGSFGPIVEFSADEARQLAFAFQELAARATPDR